MVQRRPLVVYIQYTNPAAYPPLEHSSQILSKAGYDVVFLGAFGSSADNLTMVQNPAIRIRRLPPFGDGALLKLNYLIFVMWCAFFCLWNRPQWVYASDLLSCLPAKLARRLSSARILYHEHDAPNLASLATRFARYLGAARLDLARSADLCILPQAERLREFKLETSRRGPSMCVWNCPMLEEVGPARVPLREDEPVAFYYHGNLSPKLLPMSVVEAIALCDSKTSLTVVGYETVGNNGYMRKFLSRAAELGIEQRVRFKGALSRAELLTEARRARVGLAFMPAQSVEFNMVHMAGASNKPFDYLAAGLGLLVSDLPDWRNLFVTPGYGHACNPFDVGDLARAMRWCVDNPSAVYEMGESGRQRILSDWNYERCFADAAAFMAGKKSLGAHE